VLGPRRHALHDASELVASPGAAAGLVWTAHGGLVQYIECICVGVAGRGAPGTLTLTGERGLPSATKQKAQSITLRTFAPTVPPYYVVTSPALPHS
jgi:hypothetical protein